MARRDQVEHATGAEEPVPRSHTRRRVVIFLSVFVVIAALVVVFRPDGASYEDYLKLKEGMRRTEVVRIIGKDDYWHHMEGDRDVTNWVNQDGTYIRAVFDKDNVLVEVSWESGWNPEWQKEQQAQ